jgi:hypothetical protein
MRGARIKVLLTRHFLGRSAGHDAAGRAGSLRGPRRVFFCARGNRMGRVAARLPASAIPLSLEKLIESFELRSQNSLTFVLYPPIKLISGIATG